MYPRNGGQPVVDSLRDVQRPLDAWEYFVSIRPLIIHICIVHVPPNYAMQYGPHTKTVHIYSKWLIEIYLALDVVVPLPHASEHPLVPHAPTHT
jgi:hypothetical protein